eukprot:gene5001-9189_t
MSEWDLAGLQVPGYRDVDGVDVYREQDPFDFVDAVFAAAATPETAEQRCGGAALPMLLVLDQLEVLCPAAALNRSSTGLERRVSAHVTQHLDKARQQQNDPEYNKHPHAAGSAGAGAGAGAPVFIIGVTADLAALEPSVRASGRLGLLVRMAVPTPSQRGSILSDLLRKMQAPPGPATDVVVEWLAGATPGYVAADLEYLCQQAAVEAVRAAADRERLFTAASPPTAGPWIEVGHFAAALARTKPSSLSDQSANLRRVGTGHTLAGVDDTFEDILLAAGLAIGVVGETASRSSGININTTANIRRGGGASASSNRIDGDGGNVVEVGHEKASIYGQTELALAVVRELQTNVVLVTSSEIRSKVVGQAEDRTLSALLSELDQMLAPGNGGNNQVLVMCTASALSAITPSVLRPGRLDQHFEVPMPSEAARTAIMDLKLSAMPAAKHLVGTAVVHELAAASGGLSGAHLENVCREAALAGLRADIHCSSLPEQHLRDALKTLYHRDIKAAATAAAVAEGAL